MARWHGHARLLRLHGDARDAHRPLAVGALVAGGAAQARPHALVGLLLHEDGHGVARDAVHRQVLHGCDGGADRGAHHDELRDAPIHVRRAALDEELEDLAAELRARQRRVSAAQAGCAARRRRTPFRSCLIVLFLPQKPSKCVAYQATPFWRSTEPGP